MSEENIIYEPLNKWTGGQTLGYYEPETDTIHILLSDQDTMDKVLKHELKHRARRNKPTFKLAQILNTPSLKNLTYLFLMTLSIYGVLTLEFRPLIAVFSVYIITLASSLYEEKQAGEKIQ